VWGEEGGERGWRWFERRRGGGNLLSSSRYTKGTEIKDTAAQPKVRRRGEEVESRKRSSARGERNEGVEADCFWWGGKTPRKEKPR